MGDEFSGAILLDQQGFMLSDCGIMETADTNVNLKRSRNSSSSSDDSDGTVKDVKIQKNDEKFTYLISCESTRLDKIDPVKVKQWLDKRLDKYTVKPDPKGNLVVVCSHSDGTRLLKVTKFDKYKIIVKEFIRKQFQKGIIHGVAEEYSDDQLLKGITAADITISDTKRLGKSRSVVVTFEGSVLPTHVFYGYLRFSVKLFIPSPIRCYKCQRWGHMAKQCRSQFRCSKCGEPHDTRTCEAEPQIEKCCNCGENHKASSHDCESYGEAKQIIKVKTEGKMSYSEAVRKVRTQVPSVTPTPATGQTFPETTTSHKKTIVSQNKTAVLVNKPAVAPQNDFNWSGFAAFLVKVSSTFSGQDYQVKSEVEKLAVVAELISNFFQVQVKRNEACHALFSDESNVNVSHGQQS